MKIKRINVFTVLATRLAQCLLVVCYTLLPWSATAVNQNALAEHLFSNNASDHLIEDLLVTTLTQIAKGNTKQAMFTVNALIRTAPNFKLAHLIRGDLLSAHARALQSFGNPQSLSSSVSKEIEGLRAEASSRINHYTHPNIHNLVPNITFQMNAEQHLILIDTVKSRLFLFKKSNIGLQYIADYYVSIGKNGADKHVEGDKRTPIGLYFSKKQIKSPLPEFYGSGAYPLNYPNELDTHHKKTGYGIWLHGTPKDTYSRPPRSSDGCIVLSNADLIKLQPVLQAGNVPIIIYDTVQWIDNHHAEHKVEKLKAIHKSLEAWRTDWISQKTNQYLSHYSDNFFYSGGRLLQWSAHKRRVQSNKSKITVKVSNISIFSYPTPAYIGTPLDTSQILVVNFDQYYESATLQNKMRKRQYWKNENNQWKIIYEGAA